MNLKNINTVNFYNKDVFIRCDYNCPVDESNKVTDEFRIKASIPTLDKILNDKPNKLVIATHFGRPKNREEKYSTKLLIPYLKKYINTEINFLEKGLDSVESDLSKSGVYFMENVRYHDYETDPSLNKTSLNFDIYCNEAFSCSHRNHSSITCIPAKEKCFGKCVVKEIDNLNLLMQTNSLKKLAIIGGAKMDDKIPVLKKNLSKKVDYLFITGGDTAGFVNNYENNYEHISTGGGASIEYISTGTLVGLTTASYE